MVHRTETARLNTPYRVVAAYGNLIDFSNLFDGLNNGQVYTVNSSYAYRVDATSTSMDIPFVAVPEPASAGLVAVIGSVGLRRRRSGEVR
jgi:hypothetical protein